MKRFKIYMIRTTQESFIVDAEDVGEAVEKARQRMESGETGKFVHEDIDEALHYEDITEEN